MKLGVLSCGCETHPIKAKPRRLVAGSAPMAATSWAMREQASTWAQERNSLETSEIPVAEAVVAAEGSSGAPLNRVNGGHRNRRGLRPGHVTRGRPRNLGYPYFSATRSGVTETR